MSRFSTLSQAVGLLVALAVTFAAATVGALASLEPDSFYSLLNQPDWAPPGWLIGPVWSVLYTLMGISAWLVWRIKGVSGARTAMLLYACQLAANALWSWLFFAWRSGAWAFAGAVLLCLLVGATLAAFWPHRRLAAALLVPCLAWVTFAAILTWSLWRRNPALLG